MIRPSELRATYQGSCLAFLINAFESRLKYKASIGLTSTPLPTIEDVKQELLNFYGLDVALVEKDYQKLVDAIKAEAIKSGYFVKDGCISWS